MTTLKTNLLAACAVLLPTLASAHDFWIEPSTFRPARGEEVLAELREGERLQGVPIARRPASIERFVLKGRRTEASLAETGAAVVRESGQHWIGYQSRPSAVELPPELFEAYLREEGLERIIELRAKSGASDADGRERFYRCAKALLNGRGPRLFSRPLGLTLELIPRKDPYAMNAELPVALLFRGKPVANVLVVALNGTKAVRARTDANGLVKLRLDDPGFWLIKAVHVEAAPANAGVEWESWWASMTFDLD